MRTSRYGLVGFLLIAQLASAAGAQAAGRRRVNQTMTLGVLRKGIHFPSRGSSVVYAGTVKSRLGSGTILMTVEITGHPGPATFKFKGTSTASYPHGTTKGTFTGTGTIEPGGRFALAGHGRYTGGTIYRRARRLYAFTGTAPSPPQPPQAPAPVACAVPAGWKAAASDAEVVVIQNQSDYPSQEYRYCDYAQASRGFQLLIHNDTCDLQPVDTCTTVDGVALSTILYHTSVATDSPACGGPSPITDGSSTVYATDARSGRTMTLAQGPGGITAAGFSSPGVGAWILTAADCPVAGGNEQTETLQAYSVRTGAVMTLDTGDPGETTGTPRSLANLELYECDAGCPAGTAIVAWTHDGTWRYAQVS